MQKEIANLNEQLYLQNKKTQVYERLHGLTEGTLQHL